MKLYECAVYLKGVGVDLYIVRAKDVEDAEKKCRQRLLDETDEGERWEILRVELLRG